MVIHEGRFPRIDTISQPMSFTSGVMSKIPLIQLTYPLLNMNIRQMIN